MDEITALINEHGDAIYNFCMYLAKSKHDGEDLCQQVFMRAVELSAKIDKQNNPKSYLMSIAVNIWRNTVQKKARRNFIAPAVDIDSNDAVLIEDNFADTEAVVINKIINDTLFDIINKLDDKHRIPVILFYSEDMKISEISSLLRKPEGTVKRLLHEAKEKIKREMEGKGYER